MRHIQKPNNSIKGQIKRVISDQFKMGALQQILPESQMVNDPSTGKNISCENAKITDYIEKEFNTKTSDDDKSILLEIVADFTITGTDREGASFSIPVKGYSYGAEVLLDENYGVDQLKWDIPRLSK